MAVGLACALQMAGTPIGPNDTAFVGYSIVAGAVPITNDVREFEQVPNLLLEEWVNE